MCRPTLLAQRGPFRVDFCPECAATHVHIGPVSVRLDSSAVRVLHEVLGEALERPGASTELGWNVGALGHEPN